MLSKVYMRLLKLDGDLTDGDCTHGLPEDVSEDMHELLVGRWRYLHHFSMVGAAVVDPEFWDREWSHVSDGDEPSEWEDFQKTVNTVARTAGALEAKHTYAAILLDYDNWIEDMKAASVQSTKMTPDIIEQARKLAAWKWWKAFGHSWPHLRWFAMRVLAQGASACACERGWSAYEWMHSKKRNRLSVVRADKLVRAYTNLHLASHFDSCAYGSLAWDEEMVCDEPEPEQPLRRSPDRAARHTQQGHSSRDARTGGLFRP